MDYYPMFARLQQRPVLVVGAGQVAERKVDSLLQSGALVRVVAQSLSPLLQQRLDEGRITHLGNQFQADMVETVFLVIAATDDAALNQQVFLSS